MSHKAVSCAGIIIALAGSSSGLVGAQQPSPSQPPQVSQKPVLTPEQGAIDDLLAEGKQSYLKSDYAGAEKTFQIALQKAQALKDETRTANCLNKLGAVYNNLGLFDKALDYQKRGLDLREKLGNQTDISGSLNNIGSVYLYMGQFDKAIAFLQRSLKIAEKLNDLQMLSRCLNNLGIGYYRLGQIEKSLDYNQRALSLLEKLGNSADIAASLDNIGILYRVLGQFDKALDNNRRAFDLFDKLGAQQDGAASLENIGLDYSDLNQMDKALDYHLRALSIREKLGYPQGIAYSLFNISNVYQILGQFDKAFEYNQRAFVLLEKLGNAQDIAQCLDGLGCIYRGMGKFKDALDYCQRALAIREKLGNQQDIASSLENLGVIYTDLDQFSKALDYDQRALVLSEKWGNPKYIAIHLKNLGNVYYNLNQFPKARDVYRRSYALAESMDNKWLMAGNLENLAQTEEMLGNLPAAETYFRQVLKNYESVQAQVIEASDLGALQVSELGNPYLQYADLLVHILRPEEALTVLEGGRTRGLAKKAAQNHVDLTGLLSPDDAKQIQAHETELRATQSRWQNAPDDKQQRTRKQEYYAQLRTYEQLRSRLFAQPRYADFRRLKGEAPPTFAQLQSLSRQHADTLYLEYGVVDTDKTEKTLLFMLQNGVLHVFASPVGEKTLSDQVNSWRIALTNTLSDTAEEQKRATSLFATLLGPAEKAGLLKKGHHLVVVADGPLLDLPFAALIDGHNQRLIARIPISYSFSLGSLTWPNDKASPSASLLCAADPFGSENQTVQNTQSAVAPAITLALRETPGPLPSARQEATTLVGLVPGAKGYLGATATVKTVTDEMPRYALLHFATHGLSDGRQGMRSCLALADGYLSAREIAGMKLSAQLATLSACQTARGEKSGGEGLLGLAWAFRAAGVPAIVASQWRVSDAATGELMGAFYKGLLSGEAKDVALQQAMVKLAKQSGKERPFYWAAFTVIGDSRPLTLRQTAKGSGK